MNKRSIYLKSISCKGIKSPIPLTAPSLYATVSLSATSQRHRTPIDAVNGEDPEWECPMRFDLPTPSSDDQDLFLEFDLTAHIPVLGNRLVGKAHIPVSDLIDGGSSGHVSYQVLWPDGKANGTIQLWYRIEGSELPRVMASSSPEPSAPPRADFSYKPPVEPGPVYPPTVQSTAPFNSQSVNSGPVYPPMPGLEAYNSEPINPGPYEPGRFYGRPTGTEYMPYPPPPNSGVYPPPNSGFGSLVPCYPPPRTQNPLMDQDASISTTYYPPPGTHNPPGNYTERGSTYYPPPETRHPPAVGNDYRDSGYREAQEPVVAYPGGNGYYPPPPRYPYY